MDATNTTCTPVTQPRLDDTIAREGLIMSRAPGGEAVICFNGSAGRPELRVIVASQSDGSYVSMYATLATRYPLDAMLTAQQHLLHWQSQHRWVFGQVVVVEDGIVVGAEVHVPVATGATDAQLTEWLRRALHVLSGMVESAHDELQKLPPVPTDGLPSADELAAWFDA